MSTQDTKKTISQLIDEAENAASDAETEAGSAAQSALRASELLRQIRDRLAKLAPANTMELDRGDTMDALIEFAEAKGVSRYPEGTFLHRLRAATRP